MKREKYEGVVSNCYRQGWKARCLPVEVGCRGFEGQFLYRAFTALGVTGEGGGGPCTTTQKLQRKPLSGSGSRKQILESAARAQVEARLTSAGSHELKEGV